MILDEILAYKKEFVAEAKGRVPLEEVQSAAGAAPAARPFIRALQPSAAGIRVIAEIKKASPSQGIIRPDFDPAFIARRYEECGAAAVSVLTDEKYFAGSLEHLRAVRASVSLPILRKEFIIDEYQVWEARATGADAILLIAAILSDAELGAFHALSQKMGMASLVEIHTEVELRRALKIKPLIIGINNRNLGDFSVDVRQTARLRPLIPEGICVVSESGVTIPSDVAFLKSLGIHAILVGETLMRAHDPGTALKALIQ